MPPDRAVTLKRGYIMDAAAALKEIIEGQKNLAPFDLSSLVAGKSALIVVDMINGFAVAGALASPRVGAIADETARIAKECLGNDIPVVAMADCHTAASVEFTAFSRHCLEGTQEAQLVEPLRKLSGYTLIHKNSTNSFLEDEFKAWLKSHPEINTFVIIGDCTDICVLQLALTLKTEFNRLDRPSRIIVSKDATATYDAPGHNAELCESMALYNMTMSGIEVVGRIS